MWRPAQRVRLYADEHIPKAVTEGLRRRGVDVVTCQEAGLRGAADPEHLAFALQSRRSVLTRDADFLRLHSQGQSHAGILYCPREHSVGQTIRSVMLVHEVLSAQDMIDHVEFLA